MWKILCSLCTVPGLAAGGSRDHQLPAVLGAVPEVAGQEPPCCPHTFHGLCRPGECRCSGCVCAWAISRWQQNPGYAQEVPAMARAVPLPRAQLMGGQPRHWKDSWLLTAPFVQQTALLFTAQIGDKTVVQTTFLSLASNFQRNPHKASHSVQ